MGEYSVRCCDDGMIHLSPLDNQYPSSSRGKCRQKQWYGCSGYLAVSIGVRLVGGKPLVVCCHKYGEQETMHSVGIVDQAKLHDNIFDPPSHDLELGWASDGVTETVMC